ncbi:MAG TPA: phasin family protein [Thermoanaerobaculia bacterium]|nr:phasin family protein [Thermoanaerobaculia bacterium]
MRRELKDTVHRVWLAGLGALATAQQSEREGDTLFRELVKKGEEVEREIDLPYPEIESAGYEVREAAAGLLEDRQLLAAAGVLLERIADQKERMREMIDAMLPPSAVPSPVAVLQARRNAEARAALFAEFGGLTSADVAELAGSKARNKAALANRWKQEGRIFSVPYQGGTYFPGFQFDAQGRPRPVVAEVIAVLGPPVSTEWELALWFMGRHGSVGDRRPVDLLDSEPDAVIQAARYEAEGPVF